MCYVVRSAIKNIYHDCSGTFRVIQGYTDRIDLNEAHTKRGYYKYCPSEYWTWKQYFKNKMTSPLQEKWMGWGQTPHPTAVDTDMKTGDACI